VQDVKQKYPPLTIGNRRRGASGGGGGSCCEIPSGVKITSLESICSEGENGSTVPMQGTAIRVLIRAVMELVKINFREGPTRKMGLLHAFLQTARCCSSGWMVKKRLLTACRSSGGSSSFKGEKVEDRLEVCKEALPHYAFSHLLNRLTLQETSYYKRLCSINGALPLSVDCLTQLEKPPVSWEVQEPSSNSNLAFPC